jgi:HD-GYP domain-containing protein (c-di-GMP phosphodiesterase class II)
MNAIALRDLKPNTFFTKYLYLSGGYVLLAPETPVTQELINRLTRWEFRLLSSEGSAVESIAEAPIASDAGEAPAAATGKAADSGADEEGLKAIMVFYEKYTLYVESVYTRFVTKTELDFGELMGKMKGLCELVAEHRRLVLRAQAMIQPHKNYLVSHAVHTSVISVILGMTLKLPAFRLIEIGAAAVLHELGMVRLPPQLYMAGRPLTPTEKKSITTHPVLGYNLLKEHQVPLAVCLAVLEHHERMNGSGYPRALSGDKISQYARIIMVACSFDAATTTRPHKEAKDGYAGMLDILRNDGKQYDETVIRALVYSLSIYPIGSPVLLTNGKTAMVVDVNPENPRFPIVQILGVRTPDGKELVLRTAETGLRILRPLTKEEAGKARAQAEAQ